MEKAPKAWIYYVEDDQSLGFVTADQLERKGYGVRHYMDGKTALEHFDSEDYDICVLDVMLPNMDGFELARRIRQIDRAIPILFLTARSMKEDRMQGFALGGDDYITKPYSVEELIMKIEVFLRRRQITGLDKDPGVLTVGTFEFSHGDLSLRRGDRRRQLTQKEADILLYFARRQNQLIQRSDMLRDLWGEDDYFLGRSMDVFISKLRKYLREDPNIEIQNVHGVGFKLAVGEE